jgi:hypothetical protein
MSFQLRDSSGTVWDVTITTLGELQASVSAGGSAAAGIELSPTGQDIIKGALRLLGVLSAGEEPSAEDEADALSALNGMIDSWNTEGTLVYATTRNEYTLTDGTASYTIGSGGTFNTTRPLRIRNAAVIPVGNSFEYPMDILTSDEWAQIANKDLTGIPYSLHYRPLAAQGSVELYVTPDDAHTLVIYEDSHLAQISSASAYLDLAPGYTRALRYNLAVELAPEYNKQVPAAVAAIAILSKSNIARANDEPAVMSCPDLDSSGGGWIDSSAFKGGY